MKQIKTLANSNMLWTCFNVICSVKFRDLQIFFFAINAFLCCCFSCQGLFARRRQLLLTEGPHLYYVDPVNKVLKGEIPWSLELRPEAKNFKTFFVHTVSYLNFFLSYNKCPVTLVQFVSDEIFCGVTRVILKHRC